MQKMMKRMSAMARFRIRRLVVVFIVLLKQMIETTRMLPTNPTKIIIENKMGTRIGTTLCSCSMSLTTISVESWFLDSNELLLCSIVSMRLMSWSDWLTSASLVRRFSWSNLQYLLSSDRLCSPVTYHLQRHVLGESQVDLLSMNYVEIMIAWLYIVLL